MENRTMMQQEKLKTIDKIITIAFFIIISVAGVMAFGEFITRSGGEKILAYSTAEIATAIILLAAMKGEVLENSMKPRQSGMIICIPSILFAVYNVFTGIKSGFAFNRFDQIAGILLIGFAPAILEEIIFRAVMISVITYSGEDTSREDEIIAVSVSALLFAAAHMAGYVISGNTETTQIWLQFAFTLTIGINFAITYVKTNDIYATILIHGLINSTAFMFKNSVYTTTAEKEFLIFLAVSIILTTVYAGIFAKKEADMKKLEEVEQGTEE